MEAELQKESSKEAEFERKVRQMRKERNKARLQRDNITEPRKRMKVDETSYISVRQTWGPPEKTEPMKDRERKNDEQPNCKRKRKEITTIVQTEGKVAEGEPVSMKNYEIYVVDKVDWERKLADHKEMLEREYDERNKRIELAKEKENTWQLYRECQRYLEQNERNWQVRKMQREQEIKRKERLEIANHKREALKEKVRIRKLKEKIETEMEKLPGKEKERIEQEERKERRLEIQETKKSLWKLRHKGKKYGTKKGVAELDIIGNLEEKLEKIEDLVKKLREAEQKEEREKLARQEMLEKIKGKKEAAKLKREQIRAEKAKNEELLRKRWEMLDWLTSFLEENQETWEKNRKLRETENRTELEKWEKSKRLEKIAILKKKWSKDPKRNPPPRKKLTQKKHGKYGGRKPQKSHRHRQKN